MEFLLRTATVAEFNQLILQIDLRIFVSFRVSLIKLYLFRHFMHDSKGFTEVINRNIKVGHEKQYDQWLRRYMKLESEVPGYLGTTIIAPAGSSSSVRYIINRLADKSSLNAWENSEVARKLIEEANTCSTYNRVTCLETWFTLPNLRTIAVPQKIFDLMRACNCALINISATNKKNMKMVSTG